MGALGIFAAAAYAGFIVLASIASALWGVLFAAAMSLRDAATAVVSAASSLAGSAPTIVAVAGLGFSKAADAAYPASTVLQALLRIRSRTATPANLYVAYLRMTYGGGAGDAIIGLLVLGAFGGGVVMLIVAPPLQYAADEAYCSVYWGKSYVDYLLGVLQIFYDPVAQALNHVVALLEEVAQEAAARLFQLVLVFAGIVARIATQPKEAFVCGTSSYPSCVGYEDSAAFDCTPEQLRCLALDTLRFGVEDVAGALVRVVFGLLGAGTDVADDILSLVWLVADTATLPLGFLVGFAGPSGCSSNAACSVCSLRTPSATTCCTARATQCLITRWFDDLANMRSVAYMVIIKIPIIGQIIELVVGLGQAILDLLNEYVIDNINFVLNLIVPPVVDGINAFLRVLCDIIKALDDACFGCTGVSGGSTCGWGIATPTDLVPRLDLSDLVGFDIQPPESPFRRLLEWEEGGGEGGEEKGGWEGGVPPQPWATSARWADVVAANVPPGEAVWVAASPAGRRHQDQAQGTRMVEEGRLVWAGAAWEDAPTAWGEVGEGVDVGQASLRSVTQHTRAPGSAAWHGHRPSVAAERALLGLAALHRGGEEWREWVAAGAQAASGTSTGTGTGTPSVLHPPTPSGEVEACDALGRPATWLPVLAHEVASTGAVPLREGGWRARDGTSARAPGPGRGNSTAEAAAGRGPARSLLDCTDLQDPFLTIEGDVSSLATFTVTVVQGAVGYAVTGLALLVKWTVEVQAVQLGVLAGGASAATNTTVPTAPPPAWWEHWTNPRVVVGDLLAATLSAADAIIDTGGATTNLEDVDVAAEFGAFNEWKHALVLEVLSLVENAEALLVAVVEAIDLNPASLTGLVSYALSYVECAEYHPLTNPDPAAYKWGCLRYLWIPPSMSFVTTQIELPTNVDWGVACTAPGGRTNEGLLYDYVDSFGAPIPCICPGAAYASCETVYPTGSSLIAALVTGAFEAASAAMQGLVPGQTAWTEAGAGPAFGVEDLLALRFRLVLILRPLLVIDKLVSPFDLVPLSAEWLRTGMDPATGRSRAAPLFFGAQGDALGTSAWTCLLVRLPDATWDGAVVAAYLLAFAAAQVVLVVISGAVWAVAGGMVQGLLGMVAAVFAAVQVLATEMRVTRLEADAEETRALALVGVNAAGQGGPARTGGGSGAVGGGGAGGGGGPPFGAVAPQRSGGVWARALALGWGARPLGAHGRRPAGQPPPAALRPPLPSGSDRDDGSWSDEGPGVGLGAHMEVVGGGGSSREQALPLLARGRRHECLPSVRFRSPPRSRMAMDGGPFV